MLLGHSRLLLVYEPLFSLKDVESAIDTMCVDMCDSSNTRKKDDSSTSQQTQPMEAKQNDIDQTTISFAFYDAKALLGSSCSVRRYHVN